MPPECGLRAEQLNSHKDGQLFARYPAAKYGIEHKSESGQHLGHLQKIPTL